MMNPESLFNRFLTSGIEFADPETIRKTKTLNIFQLVVILVAPLLGLFYYYVSAILLFYVMASTGLLMILGIVLLRKSKDLKIAGNYVIGVVWATLLIVSWNTGAITYEGVIQPMWIMNAGLILFAIYLNGYMGGTIWTTIVFIETGTAIYLYRTGYQFPNLIPLEIAPTYGLGVFLVCLLIILLFAFLFEKQTTDALAREQEKSKALRESKRYIDYIFDRYPIPTFIIDRSHRIIQWNHACSEMTGILPGEAIGKAVWKGFWVHARGSFADVLLDDPRDIERDYGNAIIHHTDSGWYEIETSLPVLKDGMKARVTFAPILDKNNEIRGVIQTIQKIRERPSGQMDGDLLAVPIYQIDAQGRITSWNRACEDSFGYPSSLMIGKNPLSFVSKRSRSLFKETVLGALNGQPAVAREMKYHNSAGQPVYAMVRAYATPSKTGEKKECVIVNTDITDLRLKLKKVELYALETKEKLKSLSEEYELLKSNIAAFIRKKDDKED